ncbi:MAG: peptidoglycan editing factor PgeF [Elusimicrobia bacterium]|nr:peptidoglycan editing factor PgeF [Elusimicrobiota bacterium]
MRSAAAWDRVSGLCREARMASRGIPHGVTLRSLGDMKSEARRMEALARAGLVGKRPLLLKQVHGARVATVQAATEPAVISAQTAGRSGSGTAREENGLRADGWLSTVRGLPVAVYVADCLPIFLWDKDLQAAGVVHAGWRGLAAGMPRAAVEAFRRLGLRPADLCASIGPHAGPCCYGVKPEVRKHFRAESSMGDRLDLGAEAKAQLVDAGLPAAAVAVSSDCTICSPEEFFSHRRDRGDSRILAFIALP